MIDLYRFYDDSGALLYVGISLHTAVRMMDHKRDKSWWPEVASITVEHHEISRYDATRLERRTIHTEGPRHNIADTSTEVRTDNTKFVCTTCGRGIASWGYIAVEMPGDFATLGGPHRWIGAHRVAAAIAESKQFDGWRAEHPNPRCQTKLDEKWVTLDLHDVWALHVGRRPAFAHRPEELRRILLDAWEAGEL